MYVLLNYNVDVVDEFFLLVYIFEGTNFALPLKSFKLEHFFRDVAALFMKPLLAQGTCCHLVFSCSVRKAIITVYFQGDIADHLAFSL